MLTIAPTGTGHFRAITLDLGKMAVANLIVEVEGSTAEMDALIARITAIAERFGPQTLRVSRGYRAMLASFAP